jgi:hypothetical protein
MEVVLHFTGLICKAVFNWQKGVFQLENAFSFSKTCFLTLIVFILLLIEDPSHLRQKT